MKREPMLKRKVSGKDIQFFGGCVPHKVVYIFAVRVAHFRPLSPHSGINESKNEVVIGRVQTRSASSSSSSTTFFFGLFIFGLGGRGFPFSCGLFRHNILVITIVILDPLSAACSFSFRAFSCVKLQIAIPKPSPLSVD